MGLFGMMFGPVKALRQLRADLVELQESHERLEIQVRSLQRRLVAQENAQDALAHKVHGRMGGRPRKQDAPDGAQAPMTGATELFHRRSDNG